MSIAPAVSRVSTRDVNFWVECHELFICQGLGFGQSAASLPLAVVGTDVLGYSQGSYVCNPSGEAHEGHARRLVINLDMLKVEPASSTRVILLAEVLDDLDPWNQGKRYGIVLVASTLWSRKEFLASCQFYQSSGS